MLAAGGVVMEYLLMLLSAFGLGAAHALEPGHGKTVVAAYLVGSKGRTIDAILLGGIVTCTHTCSVFLLAIASTVAAAYLVPEHVQQWFAIGSGLLVIGVGAWMIYVRTRHGPPVHSHSHGSHSHEHEHPHEAAVHSHAASGEEYHAHAAHDHEHSHDREHAHSHEHPHPHTHTHPEATRGGVHLGSLIALGVSGGIVPCPAALLLIPAAIGLGAVLKGLLLVVSFSLGLALVLMAMGVITLKAAGFASGWLERGDWTRRISIASAYCITLLGVALTIKAFITPAGLH